jgi:sulfite exporter TauE/SafE
VEKFNIVSLFLLGVLGTGHCIGMYGPLVLAFPGRTGRFLPHLLYHAGRIVTYVLIGILMGAAGAGLALLSSAGGADPLQWVVRIQIGLSLLAGGFLIYFGLTQLGILKELEGLVVAAPEKIPGYKKIIRAAFLRGAHVEMLLTGMIMGFLPCGLSYAAFSRALATADPWQGGIFLLSFGMGTLPGLLLLGSGLATLARRYRRQLDIFAGVLMIGMGLSLVVKAVSVI